MSSPLVSTRFMVVSDTHNYQFTDAEGFGSPFRKPVPPCDVLLHCGDLTMVGGVENYRRVLQMLHDVPAELKLVIAGNHDLDLDRAWWRTHPAKVDNPAQHEEALEAMKGPWAKEAGVTYLEEGIHSFTLKSGAKFTVYASPWQPEFYDWGFNYERNQDRFNTPEQVAQGVRSIAENPIPNFGVIDVIMTHGPPKDILDWTAHGNAGCDNILRAVSRARPRLHCFGHIHEGYGSAMVAWKRDAKDLGSEAVADITSQVNSYPEPKKVPISFGEETLFVNASIMDVGYSPVNAPWLIDIELPKASD
jgi:predicted phosphohydrolase